MTKRASCVYTHLVLVPLGAGTLGVAVSWEVAVLVSPAVAVPVPSGHQDRYPQEVAVLVSQELAAPVSREAAVPVSQELAADRYPVVMG